MKLSYKTPGNRTPYGLSKVYFCSHHDDLQRYFEEICTDILSAASCAVWFDENIQGEYSESELFEALGSMNLFVVPITSALLSEPCRAADVEIGFAVENHIPILPILLEHGLEERFNQKFGNLQLLSKVENDSSALSYREKLARHLAETIIDEALAEKIRAAFDAYIFLSYRKKDRKYARRLMQLIHQNDFCRDIAIWYDEYLVPGENFNDSIRKALDKSHLFLLNVTPSILEKTADTKGNLTDNYVLSTEYPMALKAKKTILPAETVETDKEELNKKYKELPACVNVKESAALSYELKSIFSEIALRENDTDPQHNFFIGLAYLNGFDVEKDHSLAVELITSAAEAELIPAMEKLIFMYSNGEGTAKNAELEEKWRRRLIVRREKQYLQSCDQWDSSLWINEILYLCDLLSRTGSREKEKAELRTAEMLARGLCDKYDNPITDKDLSATLYRLGTFFEIEGDLDTAEKYFTESLGITESFTKKSKSFLIRRSYARDIIALARLTAKNGKLHKAEESYLMAYNLLYDVCKENDYDFLLADLAYVCECLFETEKELGQITKAKKYLLQAVDLHRRNMYMTESERIYRSVSSDLEMLGDLARSEGNSAVAGKNYLEAIEAYKKISDKTNTVTDLGKLALLYNKLATVANEEEAENALNQELMIFTELHWRCPDDAFFAECVKDISDFFANK